MSPFEPADGGVPRWRILYELLAPLDEGDIVTYADMTEALGVPESSRHIVQSAIRRAAREFEVQNRHALEPVPNVGYRVVKAEEHMVLARKQQKRAGRALDRGHSKVVHVDLSGLEPEVRKAFGVVAQAFAMQKDFNRRLDVRQKDLEAQLDKVAQRADRTEKRAERTEDEVRQLRERLERLERGQ